MRLSDQELELVSAKGVMLVSTKGPMEGASKVGEAEGAMQDSAKDASRDSVNLERKTIVLRKTFESWSDGVPRL
jgi:hypothetical protein